MGQRTRPPIRLRHALPGRERWDVPVLHRRPDLAGELEAALGRHPAVRLVRASPDAARVLVLFRPPLDVGTLIRDAVPRLPSRYQQPPRGGIPPALARILRIGLPDRRHLFGPPALTVVAHGLQILQGLAFVSMLNSARSAGAFPGLRIGAMAALSLSLNAASIAAQHKRRHAWTVLGQTTQRRIRSRLVARIQSKDLAWIDKYGTSALTRTITDDTARIGELVERAGDNFIEKSMTVLIAGTNLIRTSPRLAIAALLPLPILQLPARLLSRVSAERYAALSDASSEYAASLDSTIPGIVDVKSFGAERLEARRLHDVASRLSDAAIDAAEVTSLQNQLTGAILSLGFNGASAYGSFLAAKGLFPHERFNRVLFLFPQLLASIAGAGEITRLLRSASASADRIARVLDAPRQILSGPRHLPRAEAGGEIVFDDVTFGYDPAVPVLRNVSLRVEAGETLGIVGPTGSGKSTLLRLLVRFYDPDHGRILVDGIDVRELNLRDLRAAVSLVNQDAYLFRGDVRRNVLYGRPDAPDEDVLAVMREAALQLPLDAPVGERGRRLSGGERQRVAIARALLKPAPVLALDEATSHLDNETEAAIRASIRGLRSRRTIILVAHRLATVRHADRIVVLDDGRIVEEGTHESLLAGNGLYATLWTLQSGDDIGLEVRITR